MGEFFVHESSYVDDHVKIGKGTIVRNSILMQDTIIGENADLNCVISDKNVIIGSRRILCGCDLQPYFLSKGTII